MTWDRVAFDWNQVRAFLATAEAGSFSAAARALRSTQPTMGRQVAGLEEALGVTLFERSGRRLHLTQVGREVLVHVRAMGEAASRVSVVAAGHAQEVVGEVTITATDLMSSALLPSLVRDLRRVAPSLELRIVASNAIEDLLGRHADIAIRHVKPAHPELIARRLPDGTANLYASSAYLDEVGRPASADALDNLSLIAGDDVEATLGVLRGVGLPMAREQVVAMAGSGAVAWGLAVAGVGAVLVPDAVADRTPGVEKVLPTHPGLGFPVWLATHRELHTARRIRVIFDALAEGLRGLLPKP
jgi:DNA-binding transcriptional LysR family regulator